MNRRESSSLAITLVLAMAALQVLAIPAWGQKYGKITDEDWAVGAPADYPEAGAVIIFDNASMLVRLDLVTIDYHTRIKVLTTAGIEDVDSVSVRYYDGEKLDGFNAQTMTPDGKIYKVEKSAIFEKEAQGLRTLTFAFPQLSPGCIVEYKYTIKHDDLYFLQPRFFQSWLYTMHSSFKVELAPGFEYNVTYFGFPFDARTPTETKRPDPEVAGQVRFINTFEWALNNLLPAKDEPIMGAIDNYRASMRFQISGYTTRDGAYNPYLKTWGEIGELYAKDIDEYCDQNSRVKKLAEEITAGLTTPEQKSRALFAHAATGYSGKELPTSYFENKNMSELLTKKSGTGEEKNILLTELHKAAGIEAWPVYISTRDRLQFDPQYPSAQQFNYLITFVKIGEKWEFLDAASPYMPYGLLPPNCLTEGGLMIEGDSSSIVSMSIKPVGSYRSDHTRVHIGADGLAACSTLVQIGGYQAADFAERYNVTDQKKLVEEYFLDRLGIMYSLESYSFEQDSLGNFTGHINFTTPELIRNLDENLQITQAVFNFRNNPFKSEKRFFPVDFSYPRRYKWVTEVVAGDSMKVADLPQNMNADAADVFFTRTAAATPSGGTITATVAINQPRIIPSRYANLRALFDKIAAASEDKMVIVPNK